MGDFALALGAALWLLWLWNVPAAPPPRPRRLTRNERRMLGLTERGYLARRPGWWQGYRVAPVVSRV